MFIAWKVLKPFRDRKNRFIVLLGVFSAITREPLKVRQQVKHCKKGFCEIFQMGLTESLFAFEISGKICFFALFLAFLGKFLMI